MRIIVVEGGKRPYEAELEHDLKSMRRCVGGDIEAVYEPGGRNAALICNDEGKLLGLPLNRALRDEEGEIYDVIAGTLASPLACPILFTSHTNAYEGNQAPIDTHYSTLGKRLSVFGQPCLLRNPSGRQAPMLTSHSHPFPRCISVVPFYRKTTLENHLPSCAINS